MTHASPLLDGLQALSWTGLTAAERRALNFAAGALCRYAGTGGSAVMVVMGLSAGVAESGWALHAAGLGFDVVGTLVRLARRGWPEGMA